MRTGTRAAGLAPSNAIIDEENDTITVNGTALAKDGDPQPPEAHTHTLADVTDAGTAAAEDASAFDPAGTGASAAAAAVAAHEAASDPHTGYQKESEKNAAGGYAGLDGSSKLTGSQQTYGSSANTACEGNDSRLPTSGQKAALGGTAGTPGALNLFVTDQDTRLHARSHAMTGTSDHTAGNHKLFYSNGSGQVVELPLGVLRSVLMSMGASSAPEMRRVPEILASSCANSSISLSTSPATIFTETVTVAAGDILIIEAWGTLLNNSGSVCAYSSTATVGSMTVACPIAPGGIGSHASDRCPIDFGFKSTISSTSVARLKAQNLAPLSSAAGVSHWLSEVRSHGGWRTSTNNETGSQTVSLTMVSNQSGTQTLYLDGYIIWRI